MSTAGDMFAQSLVDMARSTKDLREAEQIQQHYRAYESQIRELTTRAGEAETAVAANLAEKYALRQQLARYAPNHPMLKNVQLLERVRALGERAFAINRNFDDARQAGENYFPPGMPPIEKG